MLCPKNTWIQVLNAQHKGVCAYIHTRIKKNHTHTKKLIIYITVLLGLYLVLYFFPFCVLTNWTRSSYMNVVTQAL